MYHVIQGWVTDCVDCPKWWQGPARSSNWRMVSSKYVSFFTFLWKEKNWKVSALDLCSIDFVNLGITV